jgi:hypothetical protein
MSRGATSPQATADYYRKKLEVTERELLALREAFERLKEEYMKISGAVMAYETESSSARKIVWAMAKVAGGEVRIPDLVMRGIGDHCEIESHYEPENHVTVVRAKTVDPSPPEKRNGDGKKGGEDPPS